MATYSLPAIAGIEPVVILDPAPQGIRAYGIAFDDDANMVAETASRLFIDYCDACIAHSIVHDMLDSLGIAHVGTRDVLASAGLECHCD